MEKTPPASQAGAGHSQTKQLKEIGMPSKNLLKSKALDLKRLVSYARAAIVSQALIAKPSGTLTLFAFDAGQGLSEHTAPYDAVLQILEGEAQVTIAGKKLKARTGQIVVLPARVPHAVQALKSFKMLLIMIRQK
ncbi:MAG: cupin domain-containing protein [Lentisphaerae bacterium]|nr:cupin domain-containing protein [Lentisphaerota bacterium]